MALRIPKAELAPEIAEPMTAQFGAVPEPLEVVSHNRKVAESAPRNRKMARAAI
ncbi:MAG: hypothetical protein ACXVH3_38525 [Solirubrobacteraceae bacterium]